MTPELAVFVGGFLVFLALRGSGRSSRRRSLRGAEFVARLVEVFLFLAGLSLVLYGAAVLAQSNLALTL